MSANPEKIKMILMDMDGVLTDGKVIYSSSGAEIKQFDIQDGMGITMAKQAGLWVGIITGRESDIVQRRADELNFDIVFQGSHEKIASYAKIKKQFDLSDEEICYIGDDLPDIPVMKKAGFSVAVANARDELKNVADVITYHPGGNGAVREVIEKILKAQDKFNSVLKKYDY